MQENTKERSVSDFNQSSSPAHSGLLNKVLEMRLKKAEEKAIIEKDGLYKISDSLETEGIKQDLKFKALVDEVMGRS